MQPVKVAWNHYARIPAGVPFAEALSAEELAAAIKGVENSAHPVFQLADDVFVEIPPPEWGHGDFLVYLPAYNWMVRRNYVEHWYVDMGLFRPFGSGLFGWTDLWLDVVAPEPATSYRLLDADEFGEAIEQSQIALPNAALAMHSLHRLLALIESDQFPLPEVRLAERFYERYRKGEARGRVKEARGILMLLGQRRLGTPDAATVAAVEAIENISELERLALRTLDVESWGDLLRPE